MKKVMVIILSLILVCGLVFLGIFLVNKNNSNSSSGADSKLSEELASSFKVEIEKNSDMLSVIKKVASNKRLDLNLDSIKLTKEDYIAGFTKEITGYKNAVVARPMIGAIPFVMYIFEVENATEFAKDLESSADLRWNICTEADELKTEVYGNYVFLVMTPSNFEE